MNEPITLKQLFTNRFFRVPDYQRGYAWGRSQLEDLWQDIMDIQPAEEDGHSFQRHYTGTIYVENMPLAAIPQSERWALTNSTRFLYVVDGQQRLTTLSILMNELCKAEGLEYEGDDIAGLRDCFVAKENAITKLKVSRFGYASEEGEDPVDAFFKYKILERADEVPPNLPSTAYTSNLLHAKEFFHDRIKDMIKEERELLYQKVTNSLCFNLHEIGGGLDVQAVFETMNNRGKPLTVLEKLKNRLMYLTEKLTDDKDRRAQLRKSIHNAWKRIYAELAKNPEQVLNEDEFLAAHLSVYRKPQEAVFSLEGAEKKLFEMFSAHASSFEYEYGSTKKDDSISYEKILAYVKSVAAFASAWSDVNLSADEQIAKIKYLDGGRYVRIVIAVFKLFGMNSPNGCLGMLEKVVFRNTIGGAWVMGPDAMMTKVRALYRGDCSPAEVEEEFAEELKRPVSADAVASSFAYLFTKVREVGFFKWNKNALHYLLFEYERKLRENPKYNKNFERIDFMTAKGYTIEHVLPQTWETYWKDVVQEFTNDPDADSRIPNPRKVLINTLGNLLLIDGSTNSGIGNHPWNEKHARIASGKSYGEYDVGQNAKWGKSEIDHRGRELLKFLGELIGCQFTEEQTRKALYATQEIYEKGFSS